MSATNQELTQQYYARTQASISELSTQLEALSSGSIPSQTVETIAVELARLRKEYADAISFLPSYDQRQVDKLLNDIETKLETLRVSSAPRSKFAFKRKTTKPAASQLHTEDATVPSSLTTVVASSVPLPTSGSSLSGHTHQYLTLASLSSPWSSASNLTISNLDHCIVNLVPSEANIDATASIEFTALHVRNISNTIVILPIITGSALLHDMKCCVIALGSRQFRMHTSSQVDVYISISSNPIIEHCSAIRFADYPATLTRRLHGETAEKPHGSNYLAVQDFSHIRATPSPNWRALPSELAVVDDDWPLAHGSVDNILQKLLPSTSS
ncbi:tubulin binding cofactor C-domain-containing protein [Daedaleopsis nitida]|nr:tubulin binding cofactor C-domain-containing protein [Daedaleopsis nitida]